MRTPSMMIIGNTCVLGWLLRITLSTMNPNEINNRMSE
jgi:hypothetical protein